MKFSSLTYELINLGITYFGKKIFIKIFPISSTVTDVNIRVGKAWSTIDHIEI